MARGHSLLVPYTDNPASLRGLELAFQLANGQKDARVHAVYVVEVDRRLPLDAELPEEFQRGERCLAQAEKIARDYKSKCEGDILQARDAGHAIVDEAVELGVEMIVMGVSRHSQESKVLDLGRTADYVLRHAPCEVVIVRDGAAT
ncbi:MAG: universal stress protein [Chloroflexi bacterium]|nr:universal stress protein [Chloroflexota bacterium]MCZ6707938.1 universal stress protein [Chloroflexota bacterium]